MKLFAWLCGWIAAALILTPAIALIGSEHNQTAAASAAEERQITETATAAIDESVTITDE